MTTAIDFEQLAEPFPADEIEWRVGNKSKSGDKATLLCYLTARAVMGRLDEVVGPARWRDAYTPLFEAGKVTGYLCELSIEVEPGKWVSKVDGADVTDVEPTKGGLSSALKRAAVKWSVGRYLYGIDSRYYPIVKGYGPDDAVYCPLADKSPGHILAPKLPASALPKPKGAKGKKAAPIDTTPTPEDQALADQIAADKAAREKREAERKAKHHPSWDANDGAERRIYSAIVGGYGLNIDLSMDLAETVGPKKRPSWMDVPKRAEFIRWLGTDVGHRAYDAFVETLERSQENA